MAYNPASNLTTSAGLAHLASKIFYNRTALDRLQKKFRFAEGFTEDPMPQQEGRVITFYRYDNFAANTTPTTEGTVGTSLTPSSNVVSFTLSQFSNYINVSDFNLDTAYSPILNEFAGLLGYRAGLSVDTLLRTILDSEASNTALTALGATFTIEDLRGARAQLAAVDVEPFDDGYYFVIMHPFITFDLVNDPTANGLADIHKFKGVPDSSPLLKQQDRSQVADIASCRIMESTNVFTTGTPTQYRTYIFGKGGLKMIPLAGRGPSKVTDPAKQRFKINIMRFNGGDKADPEGVIGGACAYNFVFTGGFVEGPAGIGGTYRSRTIDQTSSLG
jgi:N4-gp56 family major capsid protein